MVSMESMYIYAEGYIMGMSDAHVYVHQEIGREKNRRPAGKIHKMM